MLSSRCLVPTLHTKTLTPRTVRTEESTLPEQSSITASSSTQGKL